ncbi:hypothetical protein GCM10009677_33370 [Sphaerisporangium rubeum]|uniref:SAM-dependent methyltransferase n=1 Tax=Sphaerisporangium rubeum TaxID=321317 RepID=A0A7X0IGZ1_9ACTN|nr:class I SAM-dependent methyltransferase [Sphaerisporangium rubeum]MBB6474865.1 SAM-dependent methyltransferase [Sphaerisporangium rubeum]
MRTAETAGTEHERVIGDFYSEFPYPWHVTRLARPHDPGLYAALISQELGDFTHTRMPRDARIWVPGCGVNQALITALRHPEATVVGSDVSEESLRMCAAAAEQVGAPNLELREEGIAGAPYRDEFDYVACTGVIHHNPDPGALLRSLAAALKPAGVLELMVYNDFHRREFTAFQEATRLIGRPQDIWYAKRLAAAFQGEGLLAERLRAEKDDPDVQFADTWLNPCERTYSVAALGDLAAGAGLALEAPCVSPLGRALGTYMWEVPLADDRLRERLEDLDDQVRWQVCNLLLFDRSPLLWFYARRAGNPLPRSQEAARDRAFLDTVMTRVESEEDVWILGPSGGYRPLERPARAGGDPGEFHDVVALADGSRSMRDVLAAAERTPGPQALRRLRTMVSTPAFPYLVARHAT